MWADYLISKVSYDKNHLILQAKRHHESKNGIGEGELVDRIKISSDIINGLSYITIYDHISTWKKGNKIKFFRIGGEPYLRIDKNKVNQDYFGDIPVLESQPAPEPEETTPEQIARLEQLEKQIAELESQPTEEFPKSSRGSLPKENAEELPQELDLAPKPVSESQPAPEPEEATPEQIARLEQLEKQIAELESQPTEEFPKSSRGSLPKENAEELP
ncbi:MAG: hypothetical protein ACE5RK_04560, partial [Candidatus Nitrosomaritimum aestuariumsis]